MKIEIWIPRLLAHYNQFLYSLIAFYNKYKFDLKIIQNKNVRENGIVMLIGSKSVFLDYSDDTFFLENPLNYDVYFKRSLSFDMYKSNIHPLNFQLNLSTNIFSLLIKIDFKFYFDIKSKTEIIRALDYFALLTNNSHKEMIYNKHRRVLNDNNGRVLYMTRLWDPDKNPDPDEKERRNVMNKFRINTCRLLRNELSNSFAGVYPDEFAKKYASDILLNLNETKKGNYLNFLNNADICIADDGLKDTPGWKIGEYALCSKAIISTPINIVVENFKQTNNYIKIEKNENSENILQNIENLIKNKGYMDLKNSNFEWSTEFLEPINYFSRILFIIENENSLHRK